MNCEDFDGEKLERLKKELKTKTDLLKINEEKIKGLNEIRSSLNKDLQDFKEFKEKSEKFEKKLKGEHTEVLSKIHEVHKLDCEKLRIRIKNLEVDFFNKNTELEKANAKNCELLKEIREASKFVNKCENLELSLATKEKEFSNASKFHKEVLFEKNVLFTENSSMKQQFSDSQSKCQKAIESLKNIELERESLKNKLNKANSEIEKKLVEISILRKENSNFQQKIQEKFNEKVNEKFNEKINEKFNESQMQEKAKLDILNDEIAKKNVELCMFQTKIELFEADLENKVQENELLLIDLRSFKEENEDLKKRVESCETQLNEERISYNLLSSNLGDYKMINEHYQVEQEILERKCDEIERNSKNLERKYKEEIAEKEGKFKEEIEEKERNLQRKYKGEIEENEVKFKEEIEEKEGRFKAELEEKEEKFKEEIEENLKKYKEENEENSKKYKGEFEEKNGKIEEYEKKIEEFEKNYDKIHMELMENSKKLKEIEYEKLGQSKELCEKEVKNQDLFNELALQESLYKEEISGLTKELNETKAVYEGIMKEYNVLKEQKIEKFEVEAKEKNYEEKDNSYCDRLESTKQVCLKFFDFFLNFFLFLNFAWISSFFSKGESVKDIIQGLDNNTVFYIKQNTSNPNLLKEIKANDFMKYYSNIDSIEYSS